MDLGGLHLFTEGNQIAANLLEVVDDRKTAKIRREDGIVFSLEIVLFSLDDQQYIKDWMEAYLSAGPSDEKPCAVTDFGGKTKSIVGNFLL